MEYIVLSLQDESGSKVIRFQERSNPDSFQIFQSEAALEVFVKSQNLSLTRDDSPNVYEPTYLATIIRRRLYES
jgi:hypothetical protein